MKRGGRPGDAGHGLARLARSAAIAGVAGAVISAAVARGRPLLFLQAYLVAFLFWLGLALGSSAVLMLHHLVGGQWGHVTRRILEAAALTVPLMALLFLPLALGVRRLYPWALPGAADSDPGLAARAAWLDVPFFLGRAALYFAVWIALALLLRRWSALQDRMERPEAGADVPLGHRFRLLSGPGLAIYGLTVTFAAVDWVMSLDPHWYSTIYGVVFIVGQGLSALAFATVGVVLLERLEPPLAAALGPQPLHDLGNLLLAFVMLWAYVAFSQYLIIYAGNLPEEIPWYLRRLEPGRAALALVLIVVHFALPFVLLLSRGVKRHPRRLAAVAALLLAMRVVDLHWLVSPSAAGAGFRLPWVAALVFVTMGCLWLMVFAFGLGRLPLLARHGPGAVEPAPAVALR